MKKFIQKFSISLILILIILNSYFFIKTMLFGDTLLKVEKEINVLKDENIELEKKLYSIDSLHQLQKRAKQLGFSKKSDILHIDNLTSIKSDLQYALLYE